jgi:hypothetical protein
MCCVHTDARHELLLLETHVQSVQLSSVRRPPINGIEPLRIDLVGRAKTRQIGVKMA